MDAYLPLDTLKAVADDIWIVDGPEIDFGLGPIRFPFPTRMTVIRLPDGRLWLHSPVRASKPLSATVSALGEVALLIAPNTLHYWWIPRWQAVFPKTKVFAAPGLDRKAKRPLKIDETLSPAPPPEWAGVIDQVVVASPALTEVAFFHRPSRTLILADLIENFEIGRIHRPFLRLLARLGGVLDPDGKTPKDLQFAMRGHRNEVTAAVRQMIAWGPERIVLSHGRWYERDGVKELERAFGWVL
jgi:hypothetical protein